MTDQTPAPERERARRRRTALWWAGLAGAALAAVLILTFAVGRYGLISGPGRELVSAFVQGKKLGRYGRINVYGLSGDLWDDFTLERVTITDAKGVWLEARKVRVDWTWGPLVNRRFHADRVSAEVVRLIRRPEVEPRLEPPKPMPLSIDVDRFEGEVELLENFSKEYGRWTVAGETDIDRLGAKAVKLDARSVSRPGDFMRADVRLGGRGLLKDTLKVDVEAVESKGGPIAGSLGYSPDRPFLLNVKVGGEKNAGRADAVLKTGDFTPLLVDGRWDERGALIGGRMAFGGSDLFAPFAERLGAEAKFGLAAGRRAADRWAVAWTALAPNLSARSFGEYDLQGRTAPDGVRLAATTPSVSRLLKRELADAGRLEGVWKGDRTAWRFTGETVLQNLSAGGYRLGRTAGPVEVAWKAGRFDVKGRLTGAGGSGQGVLARLFGPRPRADFEVARLRDGRYLLERIDATGAGLKVKGSGSRGLTGALAFQGEATLTDPSTLRRGARGAVTADFRGSRPNGANRWNITFDARGRRFATGLSQFDRLIGTEPRLRAGGALVDGVFRVERARLDGAAGRADAEGTLGLDGRMNLALDWSARGPFQAGPVEIAGNARGGGTLTGALAAPRANLKSRFDQIALPFVTLTNAAVDLTFQRDARGYDGRIGLAGLTPYGPARAGSAFRFAQGGVILNDLSIDGAGVQARGGLALRAGAPSAADLTFAAGPGAFLESGALSGVVRLTDAPGTAAVLDVVGRDVRPRGSNVVLRSLALKGTGTLARLPFTVTAETGGALPGRFAGTGLYARVGPRQTLSLQGEGALREVAFNTLSPAVLALDPDGRRLTLDLGLGGGRLTAGVDQAGERFNARADVAGVRLNALSDRFEGRLTGTASLQGHGDRLGGTMDARLDDVRSLDGPRRLAVDATVKARLTDRALALDASAFDEGGVRADTSLVLPVEASARPLRLAVARDRSMSGRFSAAGEIQPIWDLLLGGERRLAGQIEAQGTLAGTLNAPRAQGYANLQGGRFEDFATGLKLTDLTVRTRFDQGGAVVDAFTAGDGARGAVQGSGRVDLRAGGASSFTLALKNFRVIDNDLAQARASGPLTVTRAADGKLALVGDLAIDEAEISADAALRGRGRGVVTMDVVEINRPAGEADTLRPRAAGPSVALDIDLDADDRVYLRGRGLDVELGLDAHVGGTVARPQLTGGASVVRGDWEFAGARFVFDAGGSVGLSTDPRRIRLDLRAVREDPSLTAVIDVEGVAAEPTIALSSEPELPQDEILSQVLFGRSASQLSPLEAAQLASALASLAGGGGMDVFGNLREFAGLDRLTFGGGDESGMTVAGGKYVAEDLYLEIIGGGADGSAVEAEWRAKRELSVVSRITGTGAATLSVRWRKETR